MKSKLLLLVSGLLLSALPASAANIYFVSFHTADDQPDGAAAGVGFTNAPDAGYTKLLTSMGHTVTRVLTSSTPDTNLLNSGDLVIISRSVPSGNYQTEPAPTMWNGITAPMMLMNGYITRGSRLGLTTAESIPDVNTAQIRLRVNSPAHPIFAGVTLTNNVMVNAYAQITTFTNATTGVVYTNRGISVNNSAIIAGGTTLAVVGTAGDAAVNGMIIGEFRQGLTTQRTNVLGAKRLVFFSGSREPTSGLNGDSAGIFDLLPDGVTLFTNAVNYMLAKTPPTGVTVSPALGTNLWEGDPYTFTAAAFGADPMTFTFYKGTNVVAGPGPAAYTIPSLGLGDAGDYHVVAANTYGSATSGVAHIEFAVLPPASITNRIISYWPLNAIVGNKTPDLVSGYDLTLVNMGATNIVAGRWGNAFQFDNGTQTLLSRTDNPGEDLPIYAKPNLTVSLWVNGPQQTDHRVFCEASTLQGNTLFDIGTDNRSLTGTPPGDLSVDSYIRNDTGAVNGDHRHTTAQVFDGNTWHHIAFVQRDIGSGNMQAYLYIDGVKDPVVLGPIRPLTPNTTAIGGIQRIAASAWFTGMIDEVAVWDRALSPQEIQILQVTAITNAPSRLQPLAINSFKAELGAIAKGSSAVLRWDVSKDATQVTIDKIGDVTSSTFVGLGTNSVTLTNSTTFVLTVKRGTDTLTATTSVAVVDAVAAGWNLLDNFDLYPIGQLAGTGYWSDTHGNSAQVVDFGGNKVLKTTTGDSDVYLNLQSLTIPEDVACTLFFRIIFPNNTPASSTNLVGLTDKTQRNYADEFANIGPILYPTPFTNDFGGITTNAWYLGARNYFGSGIDYPGAPLETNIVYNVWMDITNSPMGAPYYTYDNFTVYIQKDGDTARTVLFQDYNSDRDLFGTDPVLGGMRPNLDKLVVIGNNATASPLFDDFYISKGAYNATVPRVYGYTGQVGPLPPLTIKWSGTQLQIQWTTGTLQESSAIPGGWNDVTNAAPPSFLVTPGPGMKFYRTRP